MEEKILFYKWVRERDWRLWAINIALIIITAAFTVLAQPYLYIRDFFTTPPRYMIMTMPSYNPTSYAEVWGVTWVLVWLVLLVPFIIISVKSIKRFGSVQNRKAFEAIDDFGIFEREVERELQINPDIHEKRVKTEHYIIVKKTFGVRVHRKPNAEPNDNAVFSDRRIGV